MIKFFKEYKKLIEENENLKKRVNELKEMNDSYVFNLENKYKHIMDQKLEYMEANYKTKIERKNQVLKIVEILENGLVNKIEIFNENEIIPYIEAYLKLLKFLKEE